MFYFNWFYSGLNRSVFFRGQIERPSSSVFSNILGSSDLPVRVAINRERVHVIDDNKNVCLLLCTGICCKTTVTEDLIDWLIDNKTQ